MQAFLTTLTMVGIMLLTAVPGFILVKVKAVQPDNIKYFSKVLMFVCQPALTIYSFNKADFTPEQLFQIARFWAFRCWKQFSRSRQTWRRTP